LNQIILHCDLDCFFAAVEARDNPKYKGFPIIIGADPKRGNGRGVVSTCSYEARSFGVHSAMPISQAYRLCPQGIFLRPKYFKYRSASNQVMTILKEYSEKFQQFGIDEAYLDISETCKDFTDGKFIADNIRERIRKEIRLTISIGVAPTISLAKIASDHKKPDATTVVLPSQVCDLFKNEDITRIPGIGKKTKFSYYRKGIKTIGDIYAISLEKMELLFGKNGKWAWNVVHGNDLREINGFYEKRKSISKERTFHVDTNNITLVLQEIENLNEKIHKKLHRNNYFYKTITLKIRFEGFITYTRSKTISSLMRNANYAMKIILNLFQEFYNFNKKVRLIGIKFSNLEKNVKKKQISLLNYLNQESGVIK